MSKVIFSEGGMPVYLDDLALMQDANSDFYKKLLKGLTGQDGGFLLERSSIISEDTGSTALLIVESNNIVSQGEIIPFQGGSFPASEVVESGGIKICVKRTYSDKRTFDDGQEHFCRRSSTAFLSLEGTGADEVYSLTDILSLPELLARRIMFVSSLIFWHDIPVVFRNGYSGSIQYSNSNNNLRVKMNVVSSAKEWESDELKGVIAQIADQNIIGIISGKKSSTTGIPRDQDGKLIGYGSQISILENGTIVIVNAVHTNPDPNYGMTVGYFPPCPGNDIESSTISIEF